MNSTLHRSITHPPDTEDREVLQIPRPDELRALALTDRLSLRIGIWLLQRSNRAQRARRGRSTADVDLLAQHERNRSAAELHALLAFDLQRGLR